MPRINLLPWREAERKKRQRDFGVALAGGVVAAIAVTILTLFAFAQMISSQGARARCCKCSIMFESMSAA